MTLEQKSIENRQYPIQPSPSEPNVVILDPLTLRRSCIAQILREWSNAEGLTVKSAARVRGRSSADFSENCRLVVINVGGKSVGDADVQQNIERARLIFPDVPMIILSDLDDRLEVTTAFRSGAMGFIPTSLDPKIALRAFTFILGGGSYFPPSVLRAPGSVSIEPPCPDRQVPALADPNDGSPEATEEPEEAGQTSGSRFRMLLTDRQQQVADLLKDGLPNKIIARRLGTTEATVKVHVRQIMRKLGVKNRTQVALSISSYRIRVGNQPAS